MLRTVVLRGITVVSLTSTMRIRCTGWI